jgi:hypothetical protein
MVTSQLVSPLRLALLVDAVFSGASGGLLLLGAGYLANGLGLPATLLRAVGWVLLLYCAWVVYVARRQFPVSSAVRAVIGTNAVWSAASVALLLSRWIAPTPLGVGFVLLQALVVAAFAVVQFSALRRSETGVG